MDYEFDWIDSIGNGSFVGQLTDGTYFQAAHYDDYDHAVWLVDEDPWDFWESDDNDGLEDWLDDHLIEELSATDSRKFWRDLIAVVRKKD